MILPEPYEYIDLHPGHSMILRVDRFEDGSGVIHPRNPTPRHVRKHMDQRGLLEAPAAGVPISVEEPVLRLHGMRLDEANSLPYFDVSSKRLRAYLLGLLNGGVTLPVVLKLTANGQKPLKTYSVEVSPA